jgi:ribosomal protein L18E
MYFAWSILMNAHELADELHKIYIQEAAECWDVVEEAVTMLRQQQAEIEALKVKAHEWYLIAMEKAQEK